MGYQFALEKAGAQVLDYRQFGDWQGEWAAIVRWNDKLGVVTGAYGSCSYCDSYQGQFDDWGTYETEETCYVDFNEVSFEEYQKEMEEKSKRLAEFGRSYLVVVQDLADIDNQLKHLDTGDWFGSERLEILNWSKDNLLKHSK